jgi:hypothetical protein
MQLPFLQILFFFTENRPAVDRSDQEATIPNKTNRGQDFLRSVEKPLTPSLPWEHFSPVDAPNALALHPDERHAVCGKGRERPVA